MLTLFVLVACSVAELSSVIVYSENTPADLVEEISDLVALPSDFYLSMKVMNRELTESLDMLHLVAVFDFTYSVTYAHQLKSFCTLNRIIYFSGSTGNEEKWVFALHPSPLAQAKALQGLLLELEWKDYHLISSETDKSRSVSQFLSEEALLVLSSEMDQEVFDHLIGRAVKPSGNWKVIAITDSKGASKVLQALKNMRIYKERCALIISSEETAEQLDTGTIVVSEEGLGFSKSKEEYEINSVLRALNLLNEMADNGRIRDNEKIRSLLEEKIPDHAISNAFSVLNFNPNLTIIGNITQSYTVNIGQIVFPGNVTEFNTTPPEINISANLGAKNYDGSTSTFNLVTVPGIEPMRQIINADPDLLSNFVLQIHGTDCGYSKFNYEYVSECMQRHMNKLGAFYIDTPMDSVLKGNIGIFRENGIVIPHTSVLYAGQELFDKEAYPEVFITTPQDVYVLSITPYILNSFRWKEVLVYYHDSIDPDSQKALMDNIKILEITIKNKNRVIPLDYGDSFFKTNEEALREAASSKCRIYVMVLNPTWYFLFLEGLYDLGLRRGEVVIVSNLPLSSVIEQEEVYGHNKKKVLELADGSLSVADIEYRGEYGESIEKQIGEMIYPVSTGYKGFQIDALLLGVHTIELMLNIGRNYEDPLDMNYFMRQIEFIGCSGIVSIDGGGNGRSVISFEVKNFFVIEDQQWMEDTAGYYTIGIMIPLQISKNITWPNGSHELPVDTIEDPKCGIKESDIRENKDSIMITVYGSIAYFVVVFVSSLIVWFKFYRFEIEELSEKRELMFEDGVEIAVPFVESCQYVILGSGSSLLSFLSAALRIDSLIDFKEDNFWRIFIVMIGISLFWSFSMFSAIISFDRIFPKAMKNLTRYIGLTMNPLISKLGFVYILWTITRIFDCKEGGGDDATDAFLKEDCNIKCWSRYHLLLAIVSLFALTVYSFFASISCAVYDEAMNHVHVKTKPFFSFWKSMLGISCVLLHFHLNEMYPLILSVCYFVLFAVWTVFCFKVRAFNFGRLCSWQRVVALGVCLHFFMNVVEQLTGYDVLVAVFMDLSIILILAALGFIAQFKYFKGCFYRRKGRNFAKLLQFAYTSRMKAKELTEHQLDYRRNKENSQDVSGQFVVIPVN